MNPDDLLRTLLQDNPDVLLPLLKKAYEIGFREGMASRGGMVESAPIPAVSPTVSPETSPPALLRIADPLPHTPLFSDSDEEPDSVAEEDAHIEEEAEDEGGPQPVRASITVGGLHRKIIRHFALDRFDIDVVICRPHDPNRRQLQNRVRLSKYQVEDR